MSHIIGKVYEVNQVNMNKLIAELEKLQKQSEIMRESLEKIENYFCACSIDGEIIPQLKAREALAKIEKDKG